MYSIGNTAKGLFGTDTNEEKKWSLGIGKNFGVTNNGEVYCTGGKIAGWEISTGRIETDNIHLMSGNYINYYPSSLVKPEEHSHIRIYEGVTSAASSGVDNLDTTECSIETTFRFTNFLGLDYIITGWNKNDSYPDGYKITEGENANVTKVTYSGSDFLVTVKPTTSG
jgi:hypothetical protein